MGRKHCGKRRNCLLRSLQCFQKACFPGLSKGVIVWEWVNLLPNYKMLDQSKMKVFTAVVTTLLIAYLHLTDLIIWSKHLQMTKFNKTQKIEFAFSLVACINSIFKTLHLSIPTFQNRSLLETLWEKEKMLFYHNCFFLTCPRIVAHFIPLSLLIMDG